MAASRLLVCLPALLFVLKADPVFMTYADYDIASDRVCSRLGKRELSISLTRPLLVREGGRLLSNWPGSHTFTCRWEVEGKGRSLGVMAVIQKLVFRKYGSCLDYVQFKEDGISENSERICGSYLFGIPVQSDLSFQVPPPTALPPHPPTTESSALSSLLNMFKGHNPWRAVVSRGTAVDLRGELKTYVYVANKALKSDATLDLVIAYSGFQKCDGSRIPSTLFHCGYGLCISRQLVYDGVVNCPFGDCIDEGNCEQAKASNLTARILGYSTSPKDVGGVPPGIAATSSVFAIAIMVTIGACICFILRRNRQQRQDRTPGVTTAYPAQGANGDYMGVPMNVVGQRNVTQGDSLVPKPTTIPGTSVQPQPYPTGGGGGPPIGFSVPGAPGTAYPTNVGMPYPYPGTGTPYSVQPPPSSAASQGPTVPTAPSQEPPPPYSSLFPDH